MHEQKGKSAISPKTSVGGTEILFDGGSDIECMEFAKPNIDRLGMIRTSYSVHKTFCAIPFTAEFEYCTGDVPQEDSKSTHTLDMQINGVAPHLTRWAQRLKRFDSVTAHS
jgi:hypothetical protein